MKLLIILFIPLNKLINKLGIGYNYNILYLQKREAHNKEKIQIIKQEKYNSFKRFRND